MQQGKKEEEKREEETNIARIAKKAANEAQKAARCKEREKNAAVKKCKRGEQVVAPGLAPRWAGGRSVTFSDF